MQVWESDSEKEEKKVKEKPAAAAEAAAEVQEEGAAADTAQPAETVDESAEVLHCSLLYVKLALFISTEKNFSS